VVRDAEKIKRMAEALPDGSPLAGAPLAMAVCAITDGIEPALWIQDCAAATDNMLLAGHALGMGSAWIPLYPATKGVDEVTKLLKLPPHVLLFSIVVAGYPAESEQALDRYVHEFVHLEEWEG
jgi:nitroreductase